VGEHDADSEEEPSAGDLPSADSGRAREAGGDDDRELYQGGEKEGSF